MAAPRRYVADAHELDPLFARLRVQRGVEPSFPAEVLAAADAAARSVPAAGSESRTAAHRADRRDLAFVTIDPPGSRDLDQAFHAERTGAGFTVHYAIADVGAFVQPGDVIDEEAFRRAVTVYSPDGRTLLYPEVLTTDVASLVSDGDRPAVLWTIALDDRAMPVATRVERALIRSRAAISYRDAQAAIDDGSNPMLGLLREIGVLRIARERERGGVSLNLPDQYVAHANGGYELQFRAPLPVESWNAQISLLTGMQAAQLMLAAGVGILRTLPDPRRDTIAALRHAATALGIPWGKDVGYPTFVGRLDARVPAQAAMLEAAARLFRGAGYAAFTAPPDPVPRHAAVGAPYAHVTAPLRRLADRYALEVCLAVSAGRSVPDAVSSRLHALPEAMGQGARRASAVDAAVRDAIEAALLETRIGEELDGVVVARRKDGVRVQIRDPAVITALDADVEPGTAIRVRVESAVAATQTLQLGLVLPQRAE